MNMSIVIKRGASLMLACVLGLAVPGIAASRPVLAPEALEHLARQPDSAREGRLQPKFLNQPDVVTTTVRDDSGEQVHVALYGQAGAMTMQEAGKNFTASKRNGVWGEWEEHEATGARCGIAGTSSTPLTWPDGEDAQPASGSSVPLISIGIWYTAPYRQAVGGHENAVAHVALAAAYLQESLANTQIPGQIAITVIEESIYSDTELLDVETALNWLVGAAHARRMETNSDLFHMFVMHGGDWGGLAQVYTGSAAKAYGVSVNVSYGYGYETFAHEIGHNLGAGHDPVTGCGPDACGHFIPGVVRDFMTYWTACRACDGNGENCQHPSCPVSRLFSTPNLPFSAGGTNHPQPAGIAGQRNNARIVNYTVPIVSRFVNPTLPTPMSSAVVEAVTQLLWDVEPEIFRDGFEVAGQP